jgi:hypothetical protein
MSEAAEQVELGSKLARKGCPQLSDRVRVRLQRDDEVRARVMDSPAARHALGGTQTHAGIGDVQKADGESYSLDPTKRGS